MAHLWIAVLALLIVFAFLLRHIYIHRTFWKGRHITGPEPSFWCGNLKDLSRPEYAAPLQIRDWTKQYGKVYGIQEGWQNVLVISDLDMMQDLFLKKFEQFYGRKEVLYIDDVDKEERVHVFAARGLRWKRLRALSNPTFSIKGTVEDSVKVMLGYMLEHVDKQKSFNIHTYYQELTMDVIARISMGFKESQQFHNEYLEAVKEMFSRESDNPVVFLIRLLPPPLKSLVRKIIQLTGRLGSMPFFRLQDQIEKAVNERRELRNLNGSDHHEAADFIDLFLDVESDVELTTGAFDRSNIKVEKKLSADEVVMQCFVFLLAGFDTTANSLAYASFCIAKNQEVRKRIQQEIDEVCVDEEISYEQIQKMRYLDMVVKEALRLYPLAAVASSRTCMEATTIGDIEIDKGVGVVADVFSVHYSKEVWGKDAEEFRPERWENLQRHPLAWLPFGAGPRICIGKRLADMEEKLALIHILRQYDIVAAPDTEVLINNCAYLLNSFVSKRP
ncbi:unnamed protein product [Anisakis simplex]|uniref:Cytochrome P450 n=1 Tax=Anisakis simplex TaxID=6269 RepID=A0A0M3JZX6_ANISI|nr:unnamed protein product [Anisakis simplex]